MSEKINEIKVKLSGMINVSRALLTNATLDLNIRNADCLDYRLVNKQDGSYDKIFNVKLSELSEVEFIKDKEKMIGEKKKSASQRLRGRAFIWCEENDLTSPEDFYQLITNKIINNFDLLVEFLKDK